MNAEQLKEDCKKTIQETGHLGMILTIAKGNLPKTFPKGTFLEDSKRDGKIYRTYSFDPLKVLAWLEANT